MSMTPGSEPSNTGKRSETLNQVVDGQQNFSQILPPEWRGNLERLTIIRHNWYLDTIILIIICLKWGIRHDQIASMVMRNTLSLIVRDEDWKEGILGPKTVPVLSKTSAM